MSTLEGRVAVVTGGAGGIGKSTAEALLEAGASVVLADRDEAALTEVLGQISHDKASYVVTDVTDDGQVKRLIESTVESHGHIDSVFANAGVEGQIAPVVEYSMEIFDRVISVNIRGVFSTLKHSIPALAATGGGSIVITSSIAGLQGFAGLSAYVTSKHAVVGMMRAAVLECDDNGVRINTVHPSPINTRMMRSIELGAVPDDPAAAVSSFEAQIPMGRYGEPREVAELMRFLAGDESRFITGSTISVDGGMSVG
ncbi:SDR family NAD(P)-dependent oxidoreductase [Gordonia sp. NPDC003376]